MRGSPAQLPAELRTQRSNYLAVSLRWRAKQINPPPQDHPLSAPDMIPSVSCRWKRKYRTTRGNVARTLPAKSQVYCGVAVWEPRKSASASGAVRMSSELKTSNEYRKSFQALIKFRRARIVIAGR